MKANGPLVCALALLSATALRSVTTLAQPSAPKTRLNRLAALLEQDQAAFGVNVNFGGVGNAPMDAISQAENKDIDMVMYDMEHNPFDITALRTYMQFMLDPAVIAKAGGMTSNKSVIVRVPAYGWEIEKNTWMVKQVLDSGAHGIVFPHIENPEQAFNAIRAMRYPQKPGVAYFEPDGRRGWSPQMAARYWGLSVAEYEEKADLWRLSPDGNLIPWFIIENKAGVDNVREIARQLRAKNVTVVFWAGTGDMGMSYHHDQQAVAKGVETVLAAGKEFGMPVAMNGSANAKLRMQQGARIFIGGATAEVRKEVGR